MEYSTKIVDHHGIVAGVCQEIEKERGKIRKELWHFGNRELGSKEDGLFMFNLWA